MKSFIFITLQYIIPQHLLSRCVGWFAATEITWIKSLFISKFIKKYQVNMAEAADSSPESYACFNEFFCRALKPGARPFDSNEQILISPADGAFSQLGKIEDGRIFQAKGRDYSAEELIGGGDEAKHFTQGQFATIYLSPKDYHRLHMPIDGTLTAMTYVPGDLFSVNPTTTDNVPRLFARNERVVCHFDTAAGPMVLVLVGAMIVAAIETVWAGHIAPPINGRTKQIQRYDYKGQEPTVLRKGDEMGRFKLGSTIIMLFGEDSIDWNKSLSAGSAIQMGNPIGEKV